MFTVGWLSRFSGFVLRRWLLVVTGSTTYEPQFIFSAFHYFTWAQTSAHCVKFLCMQSMHAATSKEFDIYEKRTSSVFYTEIKVDCS